MFTMRKCKTANKIIKKFCILVVIYYFEILTSSNLIIASKKIQKNKKKKLRKNKCTLNFWKFILSYLKMSHTTHSYYT